MESDNTEPVSRPEQTHQDARKTAIDGLNVQIQEARTAGFSVYVVAESSDYAPVRFSGRRFALSGETVFSTNDRKEAREVADKLNAHYRANKIDRRVEVMATLLWRARRVERLVELLAAAEVP